MSDYKVGVYSSAEAFEQGVNGAAGEGWLLHSWETQPMQRVEKGPGFSGGTHTTFVITYHAVFIRHAEPAEPEGMRAR